MKMVKKIDKEFPSIHLIPIKEEDETECDVNRQKTFHPLGFSKWLELLMAKIYARGSGKTISGRAAVAQSSPIVNPREALGKKAHKRTKGARIP